MGSAMTAAVESVIAAATASGAVGSMKVTGSISGMKGRR
jgi:hypothetical protein